MTEPGLCLSEMTDEDIPFLQELWRTHSVMRFADEFPRIRRWSRSTDLQKAWKIYRERRAKLGDDYTQMILRLPDGTPIGESFWGPFWTRKVKVKCLIADIKLTPQYW